VKTLLFAAAVLALGACDDSEKDKPDVAARKAECKKLERHLYEISPETPKDANLDALVAKVPVEDIEQCAAAHPEAVACMQTAADYKAVRNCIPAGVECDGDKTEVKGERPIYEVGGKCKTVVIATTKAYVFAKGGAEAFEIAGNDNTLTLGPAKTISITGTGNKLTWSPADDQPDPTITTAGANNTVVKAKKEKDN
jgi:hypothetical protein